ncbi:HugZ family pyridoxamine 5'-phosphate oxidase [Thioalkalivibrio sp. HK1]|uniref:HugZ family pyridoxamine 5'-phosphate oxidase n=1 Tax=Thioalkalivibrio sp. HK1 TaxID=1469245 RepID=UPI00046ED242|nr:pyridoxamine 5'-phosphate oxidase family protein [Thioalkalivibrio sp. HK1]
MSEKSVDLDEMQSRMQALRQGFRTLLMATVNAEGQPDASYAPYVEDAGNYYVYVSDLSAHTANLIERGMADILFIENEGDAAHPFARKRATFRCRCEEIERGSEEFERILDRFGDRFGDLIDMLRSLTDFHLVRLVPGKGTFVAGFAKAFEIDDAKEGGLRHLDGPVRRRDSKDPLEED